MDVVAGSTTGELDRAGDRVIVDQRVGDAIQKVHVSRTLPPRGDRSFADHVADVPNERYRSTRARAPRP
ncbi:MAG: hypothetical protein ACR2J9_11250 [Gaiellales bacterium]